MYYRNYRDTDDRISLLGLGCMRLPKRAPDKEDIDYPEAQKLVDYAFSHGVNYFDTAYRYHGGDSELFVGQALKRYPRDSFHLATKLPIWMLEAPEDIDRIFEDQLRRLQTGYFDFYLLHALSKDSFEKSEGLGVYQRLNQLKEQGKIRRLGFSFHDSPAVLEQIVAAHSWDFAQIQLNYLDWEMQDAKGQYEILERNHIPVVIMEPVRGGALASLCQESNQLFQAATPQRSVASWAIRYAASLPGVMTVLSGMSNLQQMEDNVRTMADFAPLTQEEYRVVERALAAYREKVTIPCTGCRYCIECPQTIPIPEVFAAYNRYAITKDLEGLKRSLQGLAEQEQPSRCIQCGACAALCPQGIAIPEQLKKILSLTQEG